MQAVTKSSLSCHVNLCNIRYFCHHLRTQVPLSVFVVKPKFIFFFFLLQLIVRQFQISSWGCFFQQHDVNVLFMTSAILIFPSYELEFKAIPVFTEFYSRLGVGHVEAPCLLLPCLPPFDECNCFLEFFHFHSQAHLLASEPNVDYTCKQLSIVHLIEGLLDKQQASALDTQQKGDVWSIEPYSIRPLVQSIPPCNMDTCLH